MLFCQMFLIWVCLMFYDWTKVMHLGQEYCKNDVVSFLEHHITGFLVLIRLITNHVELDHLVKLVSAGFIHSKATIFSL